MKKFFYLMSLCLCMFAGAAVMTSCGDDDEIDPDDIKIEAGIKESGNTMTLTLDYGIYKQVHTATFDANDKCTKYIIQMVFSSKDFANKTWDTMTAQERAGWKKDGKTFTYDASEEYKDFTKDDVRAIFESLLEATQKYY